MDSSQPYQDGAGRCNYLLHKWRMVNYPLYECSDIQSIKYTVQLCPKRKFEEGLVQSHEGSPVAVKWLDQLTIRL